MQRLEVSGAVRNIHGSSGVKRLKGQILDVTKVDLFSWQFEPAKIMEFPLNIINVMFMVSDS